MDKQFDKYAEGIQIRRMSDAGISAYAIAKSLGRSKAYVLNRLPELSFSSANNIDKILSLGREGHSIKVIVQRTGTDACSVVYHLRMNGVPVDDMDTVAGWLYNIGNSIADVRAATGYSYEKLNKVFEEKKIEARSKTAVQIDNEDFFDKIDTSEKAYWLGFLCADGNVSADGKKVQVKLHERDAGHLEKFKAVIGYHGAVHSYSAVTNYGAYTFSQINVTSPRMNASLVKNGCVPSKTMWLEPPEKLRFTLATHFIRGMTDGDGSLVKRAGTVKGIKLYGVQKIVRWAEEIIPGGRVRLHSGQTWEVQWNGLDAIKKIYDGSSDLSRLDRKYEEVKEVLNEVDADF